MIIIDKINNFSNPFIQLITNLGLELFVHEDLRSLSLKKQNQKIKFIKFEKKDNLKCLNYFDFPRKKQINWYCEKFWPKKIYKNKSSFFPNICNLSDKLSTCFASVLKYHTFGAINLFVAQNTGKNEKIYIIHTSLLSYLLKNNGAIEFRSSFHLYAPFEILEKIEKKIKSLHVLFFKKGNKNNNISRTKKESPIGVFIHNSLNYGNIYLKNHLFSLNKKNVLYYQKLKLYVLFAEKIIRFKNKKLVNLKDKLKLNKKSFVFFLSILTKVRSSDEFRGAIVAFIIFSEYQGWISRMEVENLKVAIIDYDILFPKTLSLAFETLGIKTVAFQERPAASFYHKIYSTFVSSYFFSGPLYKNYAFKNQNVFCQKGINFGMWRVSKFFRKDVPEISKIKFHNKKNPFVKNKKIVLLLGYFHDNQTEYPHLNKKTNYEFLQYIQKLANEIPDANLIIRYKGKLKNPDKNPLFSQSNIFLCNDFSKSDISYSLCKSAQLIVACQTSLAEECIYFGKNVILLDNLYTVNHMVRSIYPRPFWFLAAKNIKEVVDKTKQYFQKEKKITQQLQNLRKKIIGLEKFNQKNIITKSLAQEILALI